MLVVPLQATPTQSVNVVLTGQSCSIDVYEKDTGLYMDLYVNDALIVGGVACLYDVRIVRNLYLGFIGDFIWLDTQGSPGSQTNPLENPTSDGIGTRYFLIYLTPLDLGGAG